MVNKEELKKEFTKRLSAACLNAGVAGRGLSKRIKEALKKQGISISEPGIWKWLNGASIPDSTNILALSRWLNVKPEWLEYGRETSALDQSVNSVSQCALTLIGDSYTVQVLDIYASAGSGVMLRDEFVETIRSIEYSPEEAKLIFGGRDQRHIKMIAVNGDSMSDTFEPRDQIFVDISVKYFDGDGIYIFVLDENIYIKRLQLQHTKLAVISDNKKYETWYVNDHKTANLQIVAKVLVSQSRLYKFHG